MKRPDLIVLIAVWEFISALVVLICIGFVSFAFLATPFWVVCDSMWWEPHGVGALIVVCLSIALIVMVAYFILALMSGIWLLQGKEWGRILGIVHAALSLLCIPIGTVIGTLVLVYLTRQEVREYFVSSS